jgi:hypothetical protein
MPIVKVKLFALVGTHLSHAVDGLIRETRFDLGIAALNGVGGL